MDVRYLVLILFFLSSCMPTANVARNNLSNTETTSGSNSGSGGGDNTPTSLKWNYLGQVSSNITINVSNLNTAYLVGAPLESYLSITENFQNSDYCLLTTYSIGGVARELRSRIVPISYYDFTAKRTVKVLRVDFPDITNSSSVCSKTARVMNSSGTYVADSTTPPASLRTFDPSQICPLCTTILAATKVRIFKSLSGTNTLDEVPTNYLNTALLAFQVDPNNSSNGNGGTCSSSSCVAKGFDCCLDNQCVKDGAQKPAAATQYPSLLQTAELERLQNPLAYLNYPQLYYICGTTVPTTSGSNGGSTSGGTSGGYDEAFEKLKKDYACIQNLKSQATVSPFHNEILTKTYTAATDCLTSAADASETFYYQNVMKRLYTTCGCNRTVLSDMISSCPNYDYTVTTRDTANNPIRIDCYTPPGDVGSIPSQQTVSVSSRSAPHRFYNVNGAEKDPSAGIEQEGAKFEYLDEGKVLPIQQPFSMNAILGQMSVTLDKALPAKTVNVEIDQVYMLSTTSGYYTPCPTCGKDSWQSAFTAFPSSSSGVGLQAVGYTTERDMFATNTTGGNYEDTIFGRACWIPPTMIPYSHSSKTTTQEQRLNRLEAQSALFANGYQRDWFGFNKGALIGSFDGVTWFAVGKGRIVRSTSKKLFLAINAPFADVANASMHVVNVQAYDGITQVAQVDYDPDYHQTHPYQNEAGNCQKHHLCSTDTDCITKLGWEYACADVKDLKTNWPQFDADGNEKANVVSNLTIDQILQQKKFPSTTTKRCVYRGAGAVCHTNVDTLLTDLNKTKLLTCAPNFYCANAATSGQHNSKIARYANTLDEIPVSRNHLFGKDANVLGRPHDYIGTSALSTSIRTTISENLATFEPSLASFTGLCQPGKSLPSSANQVTMANPFNQHKGSDSFQRTDFISQVGSCNSTLFTAYRHSSCPVIGSDGNYEMFSASTLPAGFVTRATNQNACGLESLNTNASLGAGADGLSSYSPFRAIEAKTLNSQITVSATLARDACFRRAGAVCHTDLDCSPNKLHNSQVDIFANSFFGNSAEKSYWSEYLVCGQTDPKPLPSNTDAYKNYDMSKNRCCREVGQDLTTFTSDIPLSTVSGNYDANTVGLKMSVLPGIAPNDAKRYSRLASVENIGTAERPILTAFQDRSGMALTVNANGTNIMTPKQWKTLSEANSETCCGGGWIRKFSDGTNDWTRTNRVNLDVSNFRCINSRTPLLTTPEDVAAQYTSAGDVQSLTTQDYGDYCKDGTNTNGACAQFSILDSAQDVLPESLAATTYTTATINTLSPVYSSANKDYFFKPRSGDGNSAVIVDYSNASGRRNITIRIPSYVTREFDARYAANSLAVSMKSSAGDTIACSKDAGFNPTSPTTTYGAGGACYFSYDSSSRILKAAAGDGAAAGTLANKRVGIEFTAVTAGAGIVNRTKPGSTAYYLKRLGWLELSGIPQIAFEMLTCNDNTNRIVPGIFSPAVKYRTDFNNMNYAFNASYSAKTSSSATSTTVVSGLFTNQYGLQDGETGVFSKNDFKCCTPLGKAVTDGSKCCSGFGLATTTSGTERICSLPVGTDLMVYFNSFVSNEGRGADKPGGGLVETDFDERTGEPLILASVNDKIRALGAAYCASGKVRQGGAFGGFEPEPQGSETNRADRIYNIVDSSNDIGQNSNAGTTVETGYNVFMAGFRWNHHLYCDY